jgi:pseudouridine synthase
MERLQKILSQAGVASRRASEQLMLDGRVTVNGEAVRELGSKADPGHDDIRVDGRRIKLPEHHIYLLLNKPSGYVTTRSDPQRRPTVLDLLIGVRAYVYPVGRLDFESEGLLILTNDGDLAARLTHPSHGVARVYDARVLGVPDDRDVDRLSRGVLVEGQRTGPAEVERRHVTGDRTILRMTLREGRNRQVRKMCEAIGHPVEHLRRIAIGPLQDTRLKPGQWRPLSLEELAKLKAAARGPTAPARPAAPARDQEAPARHPKGPVRGPKGTARSAKAAPRRPKPAARGPKATARGARSAATRRPGKARRR